MNQQIVHLQSENPFRPHTGRWRVFNVLLGCRTVAEFLRLVALMEGLPPSLNANRHLKMRTTEGLIRIV